MTNRPIINITTKQKFDLRNAIADKESSQGDNVNFVEPNIKTIVLSPTPSVSVTPSPTPSVTPSMSLTPSI